MDEHFVGSTWSFSLELVGLGDCSRKKESVEDLRLNQNGRLITFPALGDYQVCVQEVFPLKTEVSTQNGNSRSQ